MDDRERAAASNSAPPSDRPTSEPGRAGPARSDRAKESGDHTPRGRDDTSATARARDDVGAPAPDRQPMDPTRKLLKVFGVKVTDYEAKTDALLEGFDARAPGDAATNVVREVVELTADLDRWLREIQSHVLQRQEQVLSRLFEEKSRE